MINVEMKVEGDILVIQVDLSKTFGQSSSGKNTTIASTKGNVLVNHKGDQVRIGLNVYK